VDSLLGQVQYLITILLRTFCTDLGQDELASRVEWMLALWQDIANEIHDVLP